MSQLKTTTIAVYAGVAALVVGVIAFWLHWNFWNLWGGPMPGVQVLLFPGNMSLIYIWHPLFTEEIDFWPKIVMLLLGQFFVVASVAALLVGLFRKLVGIKAP
jgi:hypothetical protein